MLQEDKCNIGQNKQPGGRLAQTMREQAASPPAASASLSFAGMRGCLGLVSGAGKEKSPGLGDGGLPKDLDLGRHLLPESSHY